MVINERNTKIGTKRSPLHGESLPTIFSEINHLQQVGRRPVFFEIGDVLAKATTRGDVHFVGGNKKGIRKIREEYDNLKKEQRRKLTNTESLHIHHLPSLQTIERIKKLGAINATPTEFRGKTPDEIAAEASEKFKKSGTKTVIDAGKATKTEKEALKAASKIVPDTIEILAAETTGEFSAEDQVLRQINREILRGQHSVGRTAFKEFIHALFTNSEYKGLVIDEWNKFIVKHEEAGKATSPYETHHYGNVGLKRKSQGKDSLREEVVALVREAMGEVKAQAIELFKNKEITPHDNPAMNKLDNRLLAIGMAMYSNFARGGIYYKYRRGEKELDKYQPRKIAANVIDSVVAEFNAAEAQRKNKKESRRYRRYRPA